MAESDRNLPEHTPVAIIGGGVAGVAAAMCLAKAGIPAVLLEKGRVAGEQSSRNWGWIRKQGRSAVELPLMIEAERLWRGISEEADADFGYRVGGVTYLAESNAELKIREEWLELAKTWQLDSRMLSSVQVDKMLGREDMPGRFKGALYTPSDAYAEPALAVPAMARLARHYGARICEGVAVRGLLREGGRVAGVITERGTVRCDTVILAGGIWSRTLLENEGISFPQLAVRSSVMRTSAVPHISTSTFGATGASVRPRADGGSNIARAGAARFDLIPAAFRHFKAFLPVVKENWRIMKLRAGPSFFGPLGHQRWDMDEASPFESVRVMDPEPDLSLLKSVLASAKDIYPHLKDAQPVETWAGLIDVMPDDTPVIDHVAALPGLVLATGLSGHGFGLGTGVGKLAADLATGATPIVDPSGFALSRFDEKRSHIVAKVGQ